MPANPDFDDIATTTLRNRSGKLADNATVSVVFLDRMRKKGKVRPAVGGRTIEQELEVSLNPNGGWYSGLDHLNTNAHEPFSSASYDWKQAAVPVVWSGLDKIKNQGEHATINLITSRVSNGEKSLVDLVAQAAYSDGTGNGGKQMHGLGLFVVASPATGTVGGIDRAGNTFWRNQTATVTLTTGINVAATNPSNFIAALNSLSFSCTRGADKPDLYVADALHYNFYVQSLQGMQRVTNTEMAGAGFTALKYYGAGMSADFAMDNGYCTASTTFALNTNYIYLRPAPERDFKPFGGDRIPIDQDGTIRFIGFTGNMTLANAARQGRLFQN
jgi:hypothetical protein